MGKIPDLDSLSLRDTVFQNLMQRRMYNVLLVATRYDSFILEDDGRVDEQIYNEYSALNLSSPPRITQVTTEKEAFAMLGTRKFDLIIYMPNMGHSDAFKSVEVLRIAYPSVPVVVLTPFSKEVSKRLRNARLSPAGYVFSWLGDASLFIAIIKLLEDRMNVNSDTEQAGVQIILLVEDSVRFYSSVLTHLYQFVLEQSREFAKEALNEHQMHLRMRGRPKILLARSYEEAEAVFNRYKEHILGIVSDTSISREGKKDELAGYKFGRLVNASGLQIPFILQSSDEGNVAYAEKLGASFIAKGEKNYPQVLRTKVRELFGFGDFVIINPDTKREIMRIRDLKDLQHKIHNIPDKALAYHLAHDHFSRFFFSRAMFAPAMILKKIDISAYRDMNEARDFIFRLIVKYRRMKNRGTIAVYNRDRFDEYSNFARMGNGSLGGKGRGLAFMGLMIKRNPGVEQKGMKVSVPRTVVICTDIFDRFMELNNLYPIALSGRSDKEILDAFLEARLPEDVKQNLDSLLTVLNGPVAVRSSGLLEDAHYQPFAGVYNTYMVPDSGDRKLRLRNVRNAIKAVYASTFYEASKNYMVATQNVIDQEKMAVVVQESIGHDYNGRFYPNVSGVARSLNFYPIGRERPEDGVVSVALGLGKYIVDGGTTLHFSPRHPKSILQLSELKTALRDTQTSFYALDTTKDDLSFSENDSFNLLKLKVSEADADGTLQLISSTYDPFDQVIRDGYYKEGRKIISFAGLLQNEIFPFASTLDRLLRLGEEWMDRPVEMEFAVEFAPDMKSSTLYMLQIRPIVDSNKAMEEDLTAIPSERTLLRSDKVLGHGVISDLQDVVYVKSGSFSKLKTAQMAREVAQINRDFKEKARNYLLVGPGRWGSSDPHLGIPVKWPDIACAGVICECGLPDYRIEPSQGTHFFQNMTSLGVGYFTVNPYRGEGYFDEKFLEMQPSVAETEFIRVIHFDSPIVVKMDGKKGIGVVMKPSGDLQILRTTA